MDVARLNFSHGDYAFHRRIIRMIRRLERRRDRPVAILQDLPGPKIRIGAVEGNHVRLQTRRSFVLTTREVVGNEEMVSVNYPGLTRSVKKGDPILLGDGEIELEVVKVAGRSATCRVVVGGILGSHKGIHLPQISLNIRALTTHDKEDLAFGIEQKVDMIALSFVRNSDDIVYARREMKKRGASVPIIAKIEKHEALDHIDAILEEKIREEKPPQLLVLKDFLEGLPRFPNAAACGLDNPHARCGISWKPSSKRLMGSW